MQLSKNKLMEKIIELWRLLRWARAIKKKEKSRDRSRAEMMTEEERITLFRISSVTTPVLF